MQGWITIHRKMTDWQWYDDVVVKAVFLDLLLFANHKDNMWHDKLIKKGSLVTSVNKISERNKLSVQQVKTALKKLEKTGEINKQTTNKYTLVTICNYAKYQDIDNDEIFVYQQSNNNQITNNQQSGNNQITTNNNDNNDNNVNNDKQNIYSSVVAYLNEKTGSNYKANTPKTRSLIDARCNEGFVLKDFQKVIDNKIADWKVTEYEKYLRPETLFSNKFEGYLNQKQKKRRVQY
ncbi:MAG: conserved phage C-terminal domain-containing protein [Eubacterium sp.]|nr:conserved phage C-terminal domain-containing protein [Eubacterium sp.]MDE6752754.1 conserved phage C-terminal domain-containing protein [Eubacterium sp.]